MKFQTPPELSHLTLCMLKLNDKKKLEAVLVLLENLSKEIAVYLKKTKISIKGAGFFGESAK